MQRPAQTEATEAGIARQREALDALLAALREGVGDAEEKLRTLGALVGEADGAAARMVRETGPELVETLVRVREAAGQAATHAREAIAAVIPESVDALVAASRAAMGEAMAAPVQEQLAEIGTASHLALATAKAASERLTRQLLTIGETAAAIEERIADDRAAREEKEAQDLSRRVDLLIDALNSTAIDVSKILSNDAGDAAWAAYLKGDRGVFTRRAVRLLDLGEAREILRHYEEEPDFRDQVNRYIADFETMLRAVLAEPGRLGARHHPALLRHGQALRRARPGDRAAQALAVQPVEVGGARSSRSGNWRRTGRTAPARRSSRAAPRGRS